MGFKAISAVLAVIMIASLSVGSGVPYQIGGESARELQKAIEIGDFPDTDTGMIESNAAAREEQRRELIDTSKEADETISSGASLNMQNTFDNRASMESAIQRQAQLRAEEEETTVTYSGLRKHEMNPLPASGVGHYIH